MCIDTCLGFGVSIHSWNYSEILALGSASDTDDVWCLDGRGVLTLTVGKETYEQLGLVVEKLPWKSHRDIHGMRSLMQ